MDAIEFVKQLRRMEKNVCRKHSVFDDPDSPEDVVAEVEEWAKMNPRKTRQSVFLEQWPEATIDEDGVMEICPAYISCAYRNEDRGCVHPARGCVDCRHEFWMQEVE